jgi:hypothetical protein
MNSEGGMDDPDMGVQKKKRLKSMMRQHGKSRSKPKE